MLCRRSALLSPAMCSPAIDYYRGNEQPRSTRPKIIAMEERERSLLVEKPRKFEIQYIFKLTSQEVGGTWEREEQSTMEIQFFSFIAF
jgi:hypothetical protein